MPLHCLTLSNLSVDQIGARHNSGRFPRDTFGDNTMATFLASESGIVLVKYGFMAVRRVHILNWTRIDILDILPFFSFVIMRAISIKNEISPILTLCYFCKLFIFLWICLQITHYVSISSGPFSLTMNCFLLVPTSCLFTLAQDVLF